MGNKIAATESLTLMAMAKAMIAVTHANMSWSKLMERTSDQIFAALKEPFDPKVISWRVGATKQDKTQGIALAYIDARDAMKRLDDVMGLDWQCRYPFAGCCEIGLKINGEWVWRSNGADETDVEGVKGQYSDAFKRAAVLWGVGRYLYYLPNTWVAIKPQGKSYVLAAQPQLPAWALPKPKGETK